MLDLTQLANEFVLCQTLPEVETVYKSVLKILGIIDYTYTYYPSDFASSKKRIFESYSPRLLAWHQYFHQQDFEAIDSVGQTVRNSVIPIQWALPLLLKTGTEKERVIYRAAIEYGLATGVSIPVHGPNGSLSIFVIHHANIEDFLQKNPNCLCDTIAFLHYLHQCVSNVLDVEHGFYLTVREKECLTLTAHHKTPDEIAVLLKISKRTVNFHLENCNHKLGTKNKFQSVQKALALSMIQI